MFVPSYNNFSVCTCQKCGTPFYDHISVSICSHCQKKETEKPEEQTGFFNDEILLPVYYKRKIELTFVREESADIHHEYIYNYTAMMIPNKERWLDEKIDEAKNKMKMTGMKEIKVKMTGEFEEMNDIEITHFGSLGNSKIDYSHVHYYGYVPLEVPLVLSKNEYAESDITSVKYKSFSSIYKHVIKKWDWMDWFKIAIKFLWIIMAVLCALAFGVSLIDSISHMIHQEWKPAVGNLCLSIIFFAFTWMSVKNMKEKY